MAPETRLRVEAAISAVGYEPSQWEPSANGTLGHAAPVAVCEAESLTTNIQDTADVAKDSGWWSTLSEGDRVQISRNGHISGGATVDTLMPDGSVVWLWQDDGLGRMMVSPGQGISLRRI